MELEFLGGAGTVTGSKTLVRAGDARVLVDCGLFQGLKHLRRRNWSPTRNRGVSRRRDRAHARTSRPFRARAQPSSGTGSAGPVYASPGTIALCRVLWPDSGRLQEEDAAYAQRHGYSKHRPIRVPCTRRQRRWAALELPRAGRVRPTLRDRHRPGGGDGPRRPHPRRVDCPKVAVTTRRSCSRETSAGRTTS